MFVLRINCRIPHPTAWLIFPLLYAYLAFAGQRWRDNNEADRASHCCRSQWGKHITHSMLAGGCRVLLSKLGWKLIFGCRLLMDAVELLPTDIQKPLSSGYNERTTPLLLARWDEQQLPAGNHLGEKRSDTLLSPSFSFPVLFTERRGVGFVVFRGLLSVFLHSLQHAFWRNCSSSSVTTGCGEERKGKYIEGCKRRCRYPPLTRCCWNHLLS